jgi:hypothetical protein
MPIASVLGERAGHAAHKIAGGFGRRKVVKP